MNRFVECVRICQMTNETPVRNAVIGKKLGVPLSTARHWSAEAVAAGLIHYAGQKGGYRLGQAQGDCGLSPISDHDVAECVRALSNGKPASVPAVAKRLGLPIHRARYRLQCAETAGLVLNLPNRGWQPADDKSEAVQPSEPDPNSMAIAECVSSLANAVPATIRDIADRLKMTIDAVRYRLKRAQAAGLVCRESRLGWRPTETT